MQRFAAAWVIKTGWPAMDTLAERLAPVFAATTKWTTVGPPLGADDTKELIQLGKPAIDQEHNGAVWIVIGKSPPAAGTWIAGGPTLNVQFEVRTRIRPLLESEI